MIQAEQLVADQIYYFRPVGTTVLHKLKYVNNLPAEDFTRHIFQFVDEPNKSLSIEEGLLENLFSEANVDVDAKFVNIITDL